MADGAFVLTDARWYSHAVISIHEGHQVCLIHLIEEVDIFIAVRVAVNNEVEVIAGFGLYGEKLFSRAEHGPQVVPQRQVPVRGQGKGAAAVGPAALDHGAEQELQRVFIHGHAAICRRIRNAEVIAADIACDFRGRHAIPAARFSQDLHLCAGQKVPDDLIACARAGADIQIGVDIDNGADPRLRQIFHPEGPLPISQGDGVGAVLGDGHFHAVFRLRGLRRLRGGVVRHGRGAEHP